MKKNDHEKLRKYSVSSTGERNIVHSNGSKQYCVSIARNKQKFNRLVDTIEEGVKIRDRVLRFYEEHGRMPKGYSELEFSDFPQSEECQKCKRSVAFNSSYSYARFVNSDHVCRYCLSDIRRENSGKRNDPMRYISRQRSSMLYIVSFHRRGQKTVVYQALLEEAIAARDKIEKFYDKHLRLPTREEVVNDLKIDVLREPIDPELKNIAIVRDGSSFVAYLSRNNVRHSKTFYDLESAKAYRDYLYRFYDRHNRFPTAEESKEKVNELNNLRKEKDSLDE